MLFILVEPFYDSHNKKSVGKLFQPIFLCFKNWNVMLIKLKKHLYNIFFHIFFNDGKPIIFVFVTIKQSDSYKQACKRASFTLQKGVF